MRGSLLLSCSNATRAQRRARAPRVRHHQSQQHDDGEDVAPAQAGAPQLQPQCERLKIEPERALLEPQTIYTTEKGVSYHLGPASEACDHAW